jgi:hypothetical protein
MSSASSISRAEGAQLPPDAQRGNRGSQPDARNDAQFRPWHFFVLASLAAATAAVILSRRSSPEHLILISLSIGAAGAAAAALYRTLAPLAAADANLFRASLSERSRARLEREKNLVLRSLKELEFDKAMGKLSTRDFDEMGGRLRTRAIMLMKQLDEQGEGYRAVIERDVSARLSQLGNAAVESIPAPPQTDTTDDRDDSEIAAAAEPVCRACATVNDQDAAFCKRCGGKLGA